MGRVVSDTRVKGPRVISRGVEYALLAMLQLADGRRLGFQRGVDLARRIGAPRHYLVKTLRRLVRAKLLVAQRGHNGGFALARPAKSIRFSEVLRAIGPRPRHGDCASGCVHRGARCPLHGPYRALLDWAEGQTIAQRRARQNQVRRRAKHAV